MNNMFRTILVLAALNTIIAFHCASAIEGRWISTHILNAEDNIGIGIGVGWIIEFRPDGTFAEDIDSGFGIVEEWNGTFELNGETLSMHRIGYPMAWEFDTKFDGSVLTLTYSWKGETQYTATFKQSQDTHPDLDKLPRWPKSKSEAVALLKKKMSSDDLRELADTPKDQLIGKYHMGLGLLIRNGFGIWRGNKELLEDLTHGESKHPDGMSSIIIEALWDDLNGEEAQHAPPAGRGEAPRP